MITSTKNGHKIELIESIWVYSDTSEPIDKDRPCVKCGKDSTEDGHDACISNLPGVKNACCGHGDNDEAYIHFHNDKVYRGLKAIVLMETIKMMNEIAANVTKHVPDIRIESSIKLTEDMFSINTITQKIK